VKFGTWAPDLPEFGHEGMVKARNAYSGILGYEPIRALSVITAALPATWKGGGAFKGPDGTTTLIAATNGGLYILTASAATLSTAGVYTANWYFYQFGNLVVCVNGGAPLKYNLSAGTSAALGGTPPTSSYGAIVKDFVFLAGNSSNQNRVYWSAINNAEGWTVGTNQCDVQDLPDGGAITGLAGGEFGLAFQDDAITIFEYVGTPAIFNRRKVSIRSGRCATARLPSMAGRRSSTRAGASTSSSTGKWSQSAATRSIARSAPLTRSRRSPTTFVAP
jgi:hypothetical protein